MVRISGYSEDERGVRDGGDIHFDSGTAVEPEEEKEMVKRILIHGVLILLCLFIWLPLLLMAVSPMMGRRLFPYAENGEHQILLGNRRENRGFSVEKLRAVIQGVMSMALLVLMYTQLDGRFGGRVPMMVFYFYGGSVFLPD